MAPADEVRPGAERAEFHRRHDEHHGGEVRQGRSVGGEQVQVVARLHADAARDPRGIGSDAHLVAGAQGGRQAQVEQRRPAAMAGSRADSATILSGLGTRLPDSSAEGSATGRGAGVARVPRPEAMSATGRGAAMRARGRPPRRARGDQGWTRRPPPARAAPPRRGGRRPAGGGRGSGRAGSCRARAAPAPPRRRASRRRPGPRSGRRCGIRRAPSGARWRARCGARNRGNSGAGAARRRPPRRPGWRRPCAPPRPRRSRRASGPT